MAYTAIGGFPQKRSWVGACRQDSKLETKEVPNLHREYSDHVFIVYLHVNKINDHVYVGITHHVNPYRRWGYSGQKYNHSVKFLHAINKYGWENFDHIILCRTNKENAIVLEKTLIAHYKRLGICYNLAEGGEGSDCITEYNRKKISERMRTNHPMKGKHHTPEARAKISEAGKKRVYTEEQKKQIAKVGELGRETMRKRGYWAPEESIRRIAEKHSKPVLQLDLDGNIIAEFPSATIADKTFSNGKGHHIGSVCNGDRKTAYGFKWRYKEERRSI